MCNATAGSGLYSSLEEDMSTEQDGQNSPGPQDDSKAAQAEEVVNVSENLENDPAMTMGSTVDPREERSGRSTPNQGDSYTPYDIGQVLMNRMNEIATRAERRWKAESRLAEKRMELITRQITGKLERSMQEMETKLAERMGGTNWSHGGGSPTHDPSLFTSLSISIHPS